MLAACQESENPFLYAIVVLAISTGMRHGEIMNLTWDDVHLKRRQIVLQETKNNERRAVPIVGAALDQLKALSKVRRLDSRLLFPG